MSEAVRGSAIDLKAHNGLRGVLACWVMLFHCLIYSDYPVDLQGSSLMPFFFLLSGFSLAVVYGETADGDGKFPDKNAYFQNRLARVFPVYYICNFIALPLWAYGYGGTDPLGNLEGVISSTIVSVIPVNTFFIFLLGGPIDGPSWTVCTLAVMWWLFPYTYPSIRSRSDSELTADIANYYWVQMVLVLMIFPILITFVGFWPAFAAATMQPLVRYPLFLMGAFAGELCRRRRSDTLLWPSGGLKFFPALCCCKIEYESALLRDPLASPHWSKRCINSSVLFVVVTAAVTLIDSVVKYGPGGDGGSSTILGGWWYQAIVPFIQLEIIVSLTRENTVESLTQKVFLHPVTQWLGERSMCIYLIHWVLIYYLCWTIEGSRLYWPQVYSCEDGPDHDECVKKIDDFVEARTIPVWGIFVVIVTTLLAAEALHRFVEVPGRLLLRSTVSRTTTTAASLYRTAPNLHNDERSTNDHDDYNYFGMATFSGTSRSSL